jgi:hypothetical protein
VFCELMGPHEGHPSPRARRGQATVGCKRLPIRFCSHILTQITLPAAVRRSTAHEGRQQGAQRFGFPGEAKGGMN